MRYGRFGSAVAAAAVGVAGIGGVAAASGNGSTSTLGTAYSATLAAKTARLGLHSTVVTGVGANRKTVTIAGQGLTALRGGPTTMTLQVPTVGMLITRLIVPMVYVQLPPALRASAPGGKAWIGINLDALAKAKLGGGLSQLSSSANAQNTALGVLAAQVVGAPHKVGLARIHGTVTTAYKVTLNLGKAAAGVPLAAQAELKRLAAKLGSTTLPVEVWLDAQGRLRQLTYHVSVRATAKTPPAMVSSTVDLWDFGVPVNVVAPPASQVLNVTAQALAAAGGSGSLGG